MGISYTISKISIAMAQNTTHTTYVYASNSSTSFNDTTFASRTSDSNLVLIGMEHIQILDTIPKTCLVLTQRIYIDIYINS